MAGNERARSRKESGETSVTGPGEGRLLLEKPGVRLVRIVAGRTASIGHGYASALVSEDLIVFVAGEAERDFPAAEVVGAGPSVRIVARRALPHRQRAVQVALFIEGLVAAVAETGERGRSRPKETILLFVAAETFVEGVRLVTAVDLPVVGSLLVTAGPEDISRPENLPVEGELNMIDPFLNPEPGMKEPPCDPEGKDGFVHPEGDVAFREIVYSSDEWNTGIVDYRRLGGNGDFDPETSARLLPVTVEAEPPLEIADAEHACVRLGPIASGAAVSAVTGHAADLLVRQEGKSLCHFHNALSPVVVTLPVVAGVVALNALCGNIHSGKGHGPGPAAVYLLVA